MRGTGRRGTSWSTVPEAAEQVCRKIPGVFCPAGELSCLPGVPVISYKGDSCVCVIDCVVIPFILDVRFVDVPAGVTQEEGHIGFLIHLPCAVLALIFLGRRIQPFLSLVDREIEFCVLTN